MIYGADDLVSIPVKSPKKRVVQKSAREPEKFKKEIKTRLKKFEDEEEFMDDEELDDQENMADNIDKSINFYEDNIDEPDSPVPIKTPKKVTNTLNFKFSF